MAAATTEALAEALCEAYGLPWEMAPERARKTYRRVAGELLARFKVEPDARPLWTVRCGRHEITGYPDGEILRNVRGLTKGEALGRARYQLGVKYLPPGTDAERQDGWIDE